MPQTLGEQLVESAQEMLDAEKANAAPVAKEKTPAEIEQELLAQKFAEEAATKKHPAEAAAQLWTLYLPIYKNVVAKLSNKQLRRLLKAIIEVPLNDKPVKFSDKEEKQVFDIASNLLDAKWQMMLYTLAEHQRRAEPEKSAAEQSVAVAENETANQGGSQNG